jgi:hypothetical protein
MTVIEVKPHRNGWKVFEAPGVPHFFASASHFSATGFHFRVIFRIRPPSGSIRYALPARAATTPRAPFTVGIVPFK